MKKTSILNNKKTIIFTLLIIGIILLSPIINKGVYAKTGKLPAQITKGLFGGTVDDLTKALNLSEKNYKETDLYKQNDLYIKNKGYSVSPAVTEGDVFWTAKGSSLQQFDLGFQGEDSIAKDAGTGKISGPTLRPFVFQDYIYYKDVYCSHRGTNIFQSVAEDEVESIFKLPEGSELAKRLKHFIRIRNEKIAGLRTRDAALALDSGLAKDVNHLDAYGADYEYTGQLGEGVKKTKHVLMKEKFDYDYPSHIGQPTPSYPYVLTEVAKPPDRPNISYYGAGIVPVENNRQYVPEAVEPWIVRSMIRTATGDDFKERMFNAVNIAIEKELGTLYDPTDTISTDYHTWRDSVADDKNLLRTFSFYQKAESGRVLSPQSAFALALESKNKTIASYPGAAQEVLWSNHEDQFIDPKGTQTFVDYVVKSPTAIKTKALAEAFEAYYKRLVEWKNKHGGKFSAKFVDTDRSIIFNAKSEKYEEGSWLVGPYKLDYLLSTVKYNNQELYFAGMTNMKVFGEYTTKTQPIKEIKKWSYFVPLQTAENKLTATEIAQGKVTSLKYGVPEPNQEFFIEIPYDENLFRIAEITADFRAVDYDATADYYAGMGEYLDFEVDFAVELFNQISYSYEDVSVPFITFSIPSGSDVGILTLTFNEKVYLASDGSTNPLRLVEPPNYQKNWYRPSDDASGKVIRREIPFYDRYSNYNGGIYFTDDTIRAKQTLNDGSVIGTDIRGGSYNPNIAFSKPYEDEIRLKEFQRNAYKKIDISVKEHPTDPTRVIVTSNSGLDVRFGGDGVYAQQKEYTKGDIPKTYTAVTRGNQRQNYTIPALLDMEALLQNELLQKENSLATYDIEQGKTNKYAAHVPGHTGLGEDSVNLHDGFTYVLHKYPDVLIVPKTKLLKTTSQPQMSVKGRLKHLNTSISLKENLTIERPGFLLPIGGKVWEDNPYGEKFSTYNFILQSGDEDKNDKMLEGITVRVNRLIIQRSNDGIIDKQAARVFAKGEYRTPIGRNDIKTNKQGEWGKYYLRDLGFTKAEIAKGYKTSTHMVKFEVDFEYDGIEYMPVPPLASLGYDAKNFNLTTATTAANNSVAVENIEVREAFNKNIGEINGKHAINKKRDTTGQAIGVAGVSGSDIDLAYTGTVRSSTNRTESTLETKINTRASTLNTGLLYPLGDVYSIDMKQAMSDHSATSETNGSFDVVVVMNREKAQQFKNKEGITVKDALEDKSVVVFHETNTHMENINLGLFKRRKVDLELENDLMLSIQFVNKKALINTFANKYDLEKDPDDDYSHLISKYAKNHNDIQYQLDIYKADYIYRTAMYQNSDIQEALNKEADRLSKVNKDSEGRELDVYLQYKQAITNYSLVDHAIVSGLDMYYDSTLIPVLEPITKEIDKDEINGDTATGKAAIAGDNIIIGAPEYRVVTLDTMFSRNFEDVKLETEYKDIPLHGPYKWKPVNASGIKKLTSLNNEYDSNDIILPAARRLEVVTNFRVDKGFFFNDNKGVQTSNSLRLGNKHHLTEIAGFATYNKYTGKVTGKVDFDSAPANVNLSLLNFSNASFEGNELQDFSYLEDDSSTAPMISIELEKEAPREVSGMIWEEKRNNQIARVNMGDGIYNEAQGEKGIPNKIIALEERVSVRAVDLSPEYKKSQGFDKNVLQDTTHYVDIPYIWENKIQGTGISIDNLQSSTGFQSYLRTGTDGKYKFTGVPAGNFVVQLPYITVGNNVTQSLGILDKDKIETTKIVDVETRSNSPQVYNGQDFKVSVYDAGDLQKINETWLPSDPKVNHSYGRDSEYDRYKLYKSSKVVDARIGDALEILNIGHDKFDATTRKIIAETANMRAETPLINFGINYYGNVKQNHPLYDRFADVFALPGITKSNDGGRDVLPKAEAHKYKNVNIALEERPKTKLVLDKQISKLTLKSSDGTKIVDAKYNTTYDIENIIMPKEDEKVLNAEKVDKKYDARRLTNNGYSTEEYILKVKTEVDPDSINGEKVQPLNTIIYATKKPHWETDKAASNIYTNARGWENINANDTVSRMSNGYIHLNFDKQLLSDMNIEIEYQIQLYNLGEVDRATIQEAFKSQSLDNAEKDERVSKYVGRLAQGQEKYSKLNHEIDKDRYGFGRVFGIGYYTGKYTLDSKQGNHNLYKEKVSKTSANKIIEYIDNSAVKDDLQNDDWEQVKTPAELENMVAVYDNTGKKSFIPQTDNMVDPDGRSYFSTGGSNIYLNEKMNDELIPYYEYITAKERGVADNNLSPYEASSTIAIRRLSSQQADDDLSFDNLTEVIEYETDNGRRAPSSTPGNVNTRLSETFDAQNLESDTGLALLVTITPPTGLSKMHRALFSTLNITIVAMVSLAVMAIIAKVIVDNKQKNKTLVKEVKNIDNS